MTDLQTDWINDLKETEEEFGNQAFTWNGKDYVCIPSAIVVTRTLDEDGDYTIEKVFSLTVRQNLFTSQPKSQEVITYKGERFRIVSVSKDAVDVALRLICASSARGI